MLSFPNCKINLGLQITGKRSDGFHDLETIFFPVGIKDALEIIETDDKQSSLEFTSSGDTIDGPVENNLCIRAYELIKKDHPQISSLKMHLHKVIPSGAGLGGGSANATFTLQLLNKLFQLNISEEKFAGYALQLGSDCPFFLINKPAFASGRGEMLENISIDLSDYSIQIINPRINVNTGWAFSQLDLSTSQHCDLKVAVLQPLSEWRNIISNDFEKPVFAAQPEIAAIKQKLYDNGAIYASMSGSGSSVFGIFNKEQVPELKFPAHYFCKLV